MGRGSAEESKPPSTWSLPAIPILTFGPGLCSRPRPPARPEQRISGGGAGGLKEPTPLWLALLIESIRYRMSKATQDGLHQALGIGFANQMPRRARRRDGLPLRLVLDRGFDYSGRARHIKKVATYLGGGSRLKYRQIDLEKICDFLDHLVKMPKRSTKWSPSA